MAQPTSRHAGDISWLLPSISPLLQGSRLLSPKSIPTPCLRQSAVTERYMIIIFMAC